MGYYSRRLVLLLFEIPGVRRGLVLAGRHQEPVGAQEIAIVADLDRGVVARESFLEPDRLRIGIALIGSILGPWLRQRMIVGRDVVVKQILVGFVEIDPLLDDGLIVLVERNALGVVGVRCADESRLDLEHIILAVAVLIDPFADGVA